MVHNSETRGRIVLLNAQVVVSFPGLDHAVLVELVRLNTNVGMFDIVDRSVKHVRLETENHLSGAEVLT